MPRGSIPEPVLFNVYINDLQKKDTRTQFIIYADDTSLVFSDIQGGRHYETSQFIFGEISRIKILFSYQLISMGISTMKILKRIKTLGVIFNELMLWNDNVQKAAVKHSKVLELMYVCVPFSPANKAKAYDF